MNEAETRSKLIDPQLKSCGWGVVEDSKFYITAGKIQTGGIRAKTLMADELWAKTFAVQNEWREKFSAIPCTRSQAGETVKVLSKTTKINTK